MRFTTSAYMCFASAALVATGCGSASRDSAQRAPVAQTPTTPAAERAHLAKPIYPRCGTGRFGAPHTRPVGARQGGATVGWEVGYQYPSTAPTIRVGETTQISLFEGSPKLPGRKVAGGHRVVIANRDVSLRNPTGKTTMYV